MQKNWHVNMYALCERIIWIFFGMSAGVLFVFNIVYMASVAYNRTEVVSFGRNPFVCFLIPLLLTVVLFFLTERLAHIDEQKIFRFFSGIYMIGGAYWILNISTRVRSDAMHIYDSARKAGEGDFSFLEVGQDIYNHPWQLGMISYERILGMFSKNTQLLFLVNVLLIIGINLLTYKLADLIFEHNRRTNLLTILLSFAFLPQFFFLAFAYGLIPGFFFMLGAFYFQQKYFAGDGKKNLIWCMLFLCIAVALKSNFTVGAIAIAILFVMQMLKKKQVVCLALAVATLVCAVLPGKALIAAYERESGMELTSGQPKSLFIAMGTDPKNRGMAPGWYCGYNDYTFGQANFNPEVADAEAKKFIRENAAFYAEHPKEAASFFGLKIASVWCDPMFQSLWSGPLSDYEQPVSTRILESLYHGERLERLTRVFMKGYILLLLLMAIAYWADRRNRKYSFAYAWLFLIGGFLIHIVWEGKSQYVYPYLFILIPGSAHELGVLAADVKRLWSEKRNPKNSET